MKTNDILDFAQKFASISHAAVGQTYDNKPYSEHLQAVVDILMDFGEYSRTILAAGWLHDLVEDTGISLETVKDLFGNDIATLVGALTDEPGLNRKERKAKTYQKIRETPGAIQIKLADRLANVRQGLASNNRRMFLMYLNEMPTFCAELSPTNEIERAMMEALNGVIYEGKKKFGGKS